MPSTKQLIENARNSINQGNIIQAQQLIKKVKAYSSNPEALYILALSHAMTNDYGNAESLFKKVIAQTQPTDALLGNLGLAQLHQSKIADAINSFLAAVKINPGYYDAIVNLASCYDHINDVVSAMRYASQANSMQPDNPVILNIIAKHEIASNRLQEAINLLTRSLSIQPKQLMTYALLSNAYFLAKNYDSAEDILKNGIGTLTAHPFLLNSLGNFYASRNRHQEAINEFDKVLAKDSTNAVALAGKSRSLIATQAFDQALEILTPAIQQAPESTELITELSNFHILHKNYESAYSVTASFINNMKPGSGIPGNIAITHSISCQHSGRLNEAKNILSRVIEDNNFAPEILETVHFSYADILDSLKDYDQAFNHYRVANELIPRPSDISYYENVLDDLSNTVDRSFLDKVDRSDNTSATPVFIVGMPRSGTSLIEQIISSHPDAYGAGELSDLWKIGNTISKAMNMIDYTKNFSRLSKNDLNAFSTTYLEVLQSLNNGESRVTDKLPHNFMHIGLIECLFPNATVIHCQRHPFDTCLSIYFKKFNDNHVYARKLSELARFYLKYMKLMQHWHEVSSLQILTVNYEDMVNDQKSESQKIIRHIGLDWSDDVLKYYNSDRIIMTPSYHQASKPIYTGSKYRYKNYLKHLDPLIDILGEPEQYLK